MNHAHVSQQPALLSRAPVIFRQVAFPLPTFDYLKAFIREYEVQHHASLTNNQALAIILSEHEQLTANSR